MMQEAEAICVPCFALSASKQSPYMMDQPLLP